MNKKLFVYLTLTVLTILCFSCPSLAEAGKHVKELAEKYVLAIESGDFKEARQLASGAAVSWVEYMEAIGGYRDGSVKIVSCEGVEFSEYWLVKVVFQNDDGDYGVRYIRASESEKSELVIIDDGRRGRGWVSDNFMPGIIFDEPCEINGLRITVTALLELPSEIKFDILIENHLDRDVAIYPQLESYYTVETTRVRKAYYYPNPVKSSGIDGVIRAKELKKGFLIFPKFTGDFAQDPNLEGLRWVLYIPYGVDKQFVIER